MVEETVSMSVNKPSRNYIMHQWVSVASEQTKHFIKVSDIRLLSAWRYRDGSIWASAAALLLRGDGKNPTIRLVAEDCYEHIEGPSKGKLFVPRKGETLEEGVVPAVLTRRPFQVCEDSPGWAIQMASALDDLDDPEHPGGLDGSLRGFPVQRGVAAVPMPTWYRLSNNPRVTLEPMNNVVLAEVLRNAVSTLWRRREAILWLQLHVRETYTQKILKTTYQDRARFTYAQSDDSPFSEEKQTREWLHLKQHILAETVYKSEGCDTPERMEALDDRFMNMQITEGYGAGIPQKIDELFLKNKREFAQCEDALKAILNVQSLEGVTLPEYLLPYGKRSDNCPSPAAELSDQLLRHLWQTVPLRYISRGAGGTRLVPFEYVRFGGVVVTPAEDFDDLSCGWILSSRDSMESLIKSNSWKLMPLSHLKDSHRMIPKVVTAALDVSREEQYDE